MRTLIRRRVRGRVHALRSCCCRPHRRRCRSDSENARTILLQCTWRDICTIPVNIAGVPAISLPCGFVDGLPVGLQLIGPSLGEEAIIRAAYTYEQATGWHTIRPELG